MALALRVVLVALSTAKTNMNETKINLTNLSINDVNTLLAGLGKLPLDVAYPVFMLVKAQAESQVQGAEQPQAIGLND